MAAALFVVLATAKFLSLIGSEIEITVSAPFVYLWQDALLVLGFAVIERLAGRTGRWPVRGLYGVIAAWTVLNAVIVFVLDRPLSAAMLGAARPALSDSIGHHMNASAAAIGGTTLLVAIIAPWWTARGGPGRRRVVVASAVVVAAIGPWSSAAVETRGMHRNAVFALVRSSFPRIRSSEADSGTDWRAPLTETGVADDLTGWRGRARGRDVLLVVLESAGAGYLKPWGAAEDPMPRLTELAADALVFDDAYAVYPESIKGLVALLAGRAPALDTSPEDYESLDGPWLPRLLGDRRSALFHSGRFGYLGMISIVRRRGFDRLADAADIGGERESSFGVDDFATVDAMLTWIDEADGAPWFGAFLPVSGHHPYDAPERGPFPTDDELGAYRNALHYCDRAIGRLLDGLRDRGRLDRTLVVVVGDHGQAFRQHPGNYGHAFHLYEENVKIPLLIAAPGEVGFGRRVRTVASHVDLVPTILDLLGADVGAARFDGGSLLEPRARTALLFTDYDQAWLGLRDGRWKYRLNVESGRGALHDLDVDPAERTDRTADEPDLARRCDERVRAWAAEMRGRLVGD